MVGGIGAGFYKDLKEATSILKLETTNTPNIANKAVYEDMFGIYDDMVPQLKTQFDRLARG